MTIWFLPRAFAVIIAASAHAISSRGFAAWAGPWAMPIETVIRPAGPNSASDSLSVRRADSPNAASASQDAMITPNSSPPSRQTTSDPRSVERKSSESSQSTESPAPWP